MNMCLFIRYRMSGNKSAREDDSDRKKFLKISH